MKFLRLTSLQRDWLEKQFDCHVIHEGQANEERSVIIDHIPRDADYFVARNKLIAEQRVYTHAFEWHQLQASVYAFLDELYTVTGTSSKDYEMSFSAVGNSWILRAERLPI